MLDALKEQVLAANLLLPTYGLITFTWGNVSGIDRERGLMVIKPSGVEYDDMTVEDLVVVSLDASASRATTSPPVTQTPTWRCTRLSPLWAALSTPTAVGPQALRRRAVAFQRLAQPRATTSTAKFPAPVK